MRSYPGQIPGYPPGGLRAPIARDDGPFYPDTASEFEAKTGVTLDSLYLFDEASGNLIDAVGSDDLTVVGTPEFQQSILGRTGIDYAAASEAHAADVHAAGTTSILYSVVAIQDDTPGSQNLMSRFNASQADGLGMYNPATGTVRSLVRDSGSNSVLYDVTGTTINTRLCLCTLQIDRDTPRARTRVSDGSQSWTADVSIAGFATLDGASQTMGFGRIQALIHGAKVVYGFVASGAQINGAGINTALHRALGFMP